jgi:DNA-binding MarR family transcriptional regulator
MTREARRRVPENLTLPQFDVLSQLYRREEGMTLTELTRELLVTAGNVTGIVNRLGVAGLLGRRTEPEDRRVVRVRLTTRGRQLMQRAIPRHRGEVEWLLARMPPGDLARLRDLLGRLTQTLEERA